MSKIDLNNVAGGFNLSKINDNFQKIETALNDGALWRDNPDGEPNQMENDLDMNGNRIYNLPAPVSDNEPARFKEIKDVQGAIDQAHLYAQKAEEEADRAEREADRAFQSAVYGGANDLKVFETLVEAQIAVVTLLEGQLVEVEADETRDDLRTRYIVQSSTLVFVGYVDANLNDNLLVATSQWSDLPQLFGSSPKQTEINNTQAQALANRSQFLKDGAYVEDIAAPAYLKTVSDILNFQPISLLRNIPRNEHAAIRNGTSTYDVADKWQELIDALSTGQDTITGGTITLCRGKWNVSKKVSVRTGHGDGLSSVNVIGDGMHSSYVYALPGFTGSSMLELAEPTYCTLEGLHLFAAARVPLGLRVMKGSEIIIRDVFAQNATEDGMRFEDNFMMTLDRLRAKGGVRGFAFDGPHTSISARALYALNNTGPGFDISDITYSEFSACGSDLNQFGYRVKSAGGLRMSSCGAERCQNSGFAFFANAANDVTSQNIQGIYVTLDDCISFNNDLAGAGFGGSIYSEQMDTSSIDVRVNRFREILTGSDISVVAGGQLSNHRVRIDGESLFTGGVGVGSAGRAVTVETKGVERREVSVTSANTKVCNMTSVFSNPLQYSGLLHVIAGNTSYSSGAAANMAAYVLLVTKSAGVSAATLVSSNGLTAGDDTSHPSFTWALDAATNELRASPVGSTSGTFSFYISAAGGANLS